MTRSMQGSMRLAAAALLALAAAAAAQPAPHGAGLAQQPEKAAAQQAAEAWLALVDAGKYGESWDRSAAIFRGAIGKDTWASAVGGVRGPLGRVTSRKLRSADYRTSLPGAPDGKYVVIQYDTAFEHKAGGVETITPTLDKDGSWRVSGYYVR